MKQSAAPHDALTLLIVDDDLLSARLVGAHLARPGRVRAEAAGSAEEGLAWLARDHFDAVLLDLVMPGMDGFELVRRIRATDRSLPVFIMTAYATVEGAVEGIRAGATDFLRKPLDAGAVLALVERAVADRPLREEISTLRERRSSASAAERVLGSDPRLEQVRRIARQIAGAPDSRVLITGESGTGKSLLARLIHDLSAARGRFVEVNCAALPPSSWSPSCSATRRAPSPTRLR